MNFPFKLPLVMDGATGTNLMKAGMKSGVCPEEWILQNKEIFLKLQQDYINAGSQVLSTPTFGANRVKLKDYGLDGKIEEINKELVALTKSVAKPDTLIAGNVSTSGLMIQPYGEASFKDVFDVYFEQMQILKSAGVDFIYMETQMFLSDIRAGILASKALNIPVWVSMTLETNGRTIMGEEPLAILATAQALGATAVGINCSSGPDMLISELKELVCYSEVPLIAKPNAGLPVEGKEGEYDTTIDEFIFQISDAFDCGIYILGGCCGTTPSYIKAISETIKDKKIAVDDKKSNREIFVINGKAFFINDDMEFTEKIACNYDMIDDIFEIEDNGSNIVLIEINSISDADIFFENVHMLRRPVGIISDNKNIIEYTLRGYNGRLIINSNSDVDKLTLRELSKKYGAIIY